ncbi:hypothetical protein BH09GEM1_BH09GEM1_28510 [soil metagenome]
MEMEPAGSLPAMGRARNGQNFQHLSVMRRLIVVLGIVGCVSAGNSAPTTFVRSTSDAQVTRMLDVREGLTHTQAMRILTDALSQRYTVEVVDARAGFAMTAWQASIQREGVPDLRYRTRITGKFIGDDWRKLQLRDEANWQRGSEWDVGYDVAQLDSVSSELRTKLGKRP